MERTRRTIAWWSAGLVVAAVGAAGVAWWTMAGVPVEVVKPTRGPAVAAVYATGTVEPVTWVRVAPTVTARIVQVAAAEGETVAEGQLLARLDDGEAAARLDEARARAVLAADELARTARLVAQGHAARQTLDRAESEARQAEAAVEVASRRLAEHTINAPIAGTVLRRDAEEGEVATPQSVLFWVGRCCPMRINADVDEEDIPKVTPGQAVLIRSDAYSGRVFDGRVEDVTPKGDPVNKTFRVRVRLPDDSPLLVGMTVEVNIVIEAREDAILLPVAAIAGPGVWVVEDGRAARRPVVQGVIGPERIEILEGLSGDETVIVSPSARLSPGGRVRIVSGPAG